MRPGTKLAIMLASGALVWGIIAMALCWREKPQKRAVRVAQTALHASVDNPESVKMIAISEPDSVFGRSYIDDEEKMAIAVSMMKVNERVMSQTDDLGSVDFGNPALRELVERQMSSMSAMRSLMSIDTPDAPRKPFSGWKVKIEYEAVSESGTPYRSEYWFITDRDAQCVVSSFEIPLL